MRIIAQAEKFEKELDQKSDKPSQVKPPPPPPED